MDVTSLGIIELLHPEISVFVAVSIMALQPLRLSYFVLPLATVMLANWGHCEKGLLAMEVTEAGIVTEDNLVSINAQLPMVLTLFPRVKLVKEVQAMKALSPMDVVELGIATLDKLEHAPNAPSSITWTPLPIVTLCSVCRPEKAEEPILVTVLGMVICVGVISQK